MANNKERMVTRTIKSAIVTVQMYSRKDKKMFEKTDVFTGKFDTKNEELIFAHFNEIDARTMDIISIEEHEEKWALPERLFLQYGHRITKAEAEEIEAEE